MLQPAITALVKVRWLFKGRLFSYELRSGNVYIKIGAGDKILLKDGKEVLAQ